MDYIIKSEAFEGPFDLLLELIKKNEMNIYDLQISYITQDFLNELEKMKENQIEVTSDFIEMASILLQIKAKMLIPIEVEKDDPRNELVQQLIDYKEYKDSLEKMKELKEFETKFFKTQKEVKVKKKKKGTIHDIIASYQSIFARKFKGDLESPMDKLSEELARFKFTIEDRIEHLKTILSSEEINVERYFSAISTKDEMISTFGAILELVKIQFVEISLLEEKLFIKKK